MDVKKEHKLVKEYDVTGTTMTEELHKISTEKTKWQEFCFDVRYFWRDHVVYKWYNIKHYIRNLFLFRHILKDWRPWDYEYQIKLFAFGLDQLANSIENGTTYEETANKKVKAIRTLINLLNYDYEDAVFEKYYGGNETKKSYHVRKYEDGSVGFKDISSEEETLKWEELNKKYREALQKAKTKHYNRIFRLIQGQNQDECEKLYNEEKERLTEDKKDDWNELAKISDKVYDGTGIETWWD